MNFYKNINESNKQSWLKSTLKNLPNGARILDAGAGELKNKIYCRHLNYVSQDFCQYKGENEGALEEGLQVGSWDTTKIDIVSDITCIPENEKSFDVILCSEVLEHIPEPTSALNEFARLLKPGGLLILTAPFASNVHMAPYHYCSGFSKYWYQYHLENRNFEIVTLIPNGDWFSVLKQEIARLGGLERSIKNWSWPISYIYAALGMVYFRIRKPLLKEDVSCFGWFCIAKLKN